VSTYIEDALLIVDHEYETRISVEPGYTDDRDRECLRFVMTVKDKTSELRVPYSEVRNLAKRLLELSMGRRIQLTTKRARE
jgi:hypothetical protein